MCASGEVGTQQSWFAEQFMRRAEGWLRIALHINGHHFGEAKLIGGEVKLIGGEAKLMAGEAKLMAGEAELMAGEAELIGGEAKLMGGEAELVGGEIDAARKPDGQDFVAAFSHGHACGWGGVEAGGVDRVAGGGVDDAAEGCGAPFAGAGVSALAGRVLRPYRLPRLSAAVARFGPANGLFVAA